MIIDPFIAPYVDRWLTNLAYDLSRYAAFAVAIWLIVWVLLRVPMASRKIREATPAPRQLVTEFAVSLRSLAVFSTVGVIMFGLERNGLLPGPARAAGWGFAWGAVSLLLIVVAHDAYFYWTHRAMHDPGLIRWFHRRHHRSNNPSPFSAYSFDLSEAAVQAALAPLWLMIVPTSWPVVGLFMLHQIARNTLGHCGYEVYPSNSAGHPEYLARFVGATGSGRHMQEAG